MYQAVEFLSHLNPWTAYQHDRPGHEGFFRSSAGTVVCPVNVETNLLTFDQLDSRHLHLARLVMNSAWLGSPSGRLFIRANETIVDEYNSQFTSDVRVHYPYVIDARIEPRTRVRISFLNLTDSGNNRTIWLAVSGWYYNQHEVSESWKS